MISAMSAIESPSAATGDMTPMARLSGGVSQMRRWRVSLSTNSNDAAVLTTKPLCSPSQPCSRLSNIPLRTMCDVWVRCQQLLRKTWRQYFLFGRQTNQHQAVA
jgi:hypothetical protein